MSPVICVFDADLGLNIVWADVLDSTWVDTVRQREKRKIESVANIMRTTSKTIYHPL